MILGSIINYLLKGSTSAQALNGSDDNVSILSDTIKINNKSHYQLRHEQKLEQRRRVNVTYNEHPRPLSGLPDRVLNRITEFLPQNDLRCLSLVSKKLHRLAQDKLLKKIIFRKFTNLQSSSGSNSHSDGANGNDTKYWYVDSNYTTVAGCGDKYDACTVNNDIRLIQKLQSLHGFIASSKSEISGKTEEIIVYDELLNVHDQGHQLEQALQLVFNVVSQLIKLNSESLKILKIFNKRLRVMMYEQILLSPEDFKLPKLQNLTIDTLMQLNDLSNYPALKSLSINVENDNLMGYDKDLSQDFDPHSLVKVHNLEELVIIDDEDSSLRIVKFIKDILQSLESAKQIQKLQLKSLKFNHYHGLSNYNSVPRNLATNILEDLVDLSTIKSLELIVNCDEGPQCECFDTFLRSLARHLSSVTSIAVIEKLYNHQTPIKKHEVYEDWDLKVFAFLNALPDKARLTSLMIKNDPPLDGNIEDGLEGNYLRRRKLYEATLPKFANLEKLVLPNILSSICGYEQVVSDLLWNGCECALCARYLSLFDTYLMTHQYFDYNFMNFKDMISPRMFGFFADALAKRVPFFSSKVDLKPVGQGGSHTHRNKNSYYDLLKAKNDISALLQFEILKSADAVAPNHVSWNFHGYSKIICRDYKNDNDDDFYTEEFAKFIPDDADTGAAIEHEGSNDCKGARRGNLNGCDYDESCFDILAFCVHHFFQNHYLKFLSKHNKNLKLAVLNGVYYSFVDEEGGKNRDNKDKDDDSEMSGMDESEGLKALCIYD